MWFASIARTLGLKQRAVPFVPLEAAEWNQDAPVLRHEIGHALVWYYHGGGIGRLRWRRAEDGLLEAGVTVGPACPQQELTATFVDATAERLLAGEVAARINLGLPSGRISLRYLSEPTLLFGIPPQEIARRLTEHRVDSHGCPVLEDAAKILLLAEQHHRCRWKRWIRRRLVAAETIINGNLGVLEAVASSLQPQLPRRCADEVLVPADALLDLLRRSGARYHGQAPVAL